MTNDIPHPPLIGPDGKPQPGIAAAHLSIIRHWVTEKETGDLYVWDVDSGMWIPGDSVFRELVHGFWGELANRHWTYEILHQLEPKTYRSCMIWDSIGGMVPLSNGVYDISKDKLRPYTYDMYFRTSLPIKYDGDACCPDVDKFLSEVLTEDDIEVVLRLFGYFMVPGYPIQKAFMCIGDGANGKSTLLNLMVAFLGRDNVSHVGLQQFEEDRFSTGALLGKLANIYPDLSKNALSRSGIFKMLTGGDPITAERKFKNSFEFVPRAKLVFSCNEPPKTYDDTAAFWRRWVLLSFPNIFVGPAAEVGLLERLTTDGELSGLFNHAIRALKRLQSNNDFGYSNTAEDVRREYIALSNPLQAFCEECVDVSLDNGIAKEEFYNQYADFCRSKGIPVSSKNSVSRDLPKYLRVTSGTIIYKGRQERAWHGIEIIKTIKIEVPIITKAAPVEMFAPTEEGFGFDIGEYDERGPGYWE